MINGFSLNYRVSKLDAYSIQLFTATMVLMYRKANGHRVKCVLPMPLLAGFVFGTLSVYAYRFQLDYRDQMKTTPLKSKQNKSQLDLDYHRVDWTKPIVHYHNTSIFCLIFINDIDSVLMQHNLWLVKCGKNILYASKQKYKYIDNVVTYTYSARPWKYYCQTLMYLYKHYNSGFVNKHDWVFIANDNVWLIYENLMHLIALLNVNKHQNNYYAGQYIDGVLSIDAGVLLSTNVLTALVNLFRNVDACNSELFNSESQMLDFYLRELNNITPVDNMDSYGCSLFHSFNISDAFNETSLMPKMSKVCMSKSAITFKLGLTSKSIAMFYKYALYKIRLVTKQDLMYNASNILPVSSPEDKNIWWIEAFYELNLDPRNMSQTDFFRYWTEKRQIIL